MTVLEEAICIGISLLFALVTSFGIYVILPKVCEKFQILWKYLQQIKDASDQKSGKPQKSSRDPNVIVGFKPINSKGIDFFKITSPLYIAKTKGVEKSIKLKTSFQNPLAFKKKVLHLLGSSTSEFYFNCSIMYARSLMMTDYPSVINNSNIFMAVHPDGRWSFPLNLDKDMTCIKSYTTKEMIIRLEELKPDVMVQHIQCEDKYKYNAMFEILNIPYIGSDSHVSVNIVDKGITKGILMSQGLSVPKGSIFVKGDKCASYSGGFPAVVKPSKMENSVGVELVCDTEQLYAALERAWSFGDTVVVDAFIAGREIRCGSVEMKPGVIQPLGCIEYKIDEDRIRTDTDKLEGHVTELKQAANTVSWFIKEFEEPKLVKKLQDICVRTHQIMRCRDFCQLDFRVTPEGDVYILEVNSFCSFGPLSLIPKLASQVGISHADLYDTLLANALKRNKK